MSILKSLKNSLTSLVLLFKTGVIQEKLKQSTLKVDIDAISSIITMIINLLEKKLYTLESLQIDKQKIFLNKLSMLKVNILNTKLSQTLDLESILKERDFKPFWNEYSKVQSKKLWLPIKTDLQDLDLNLFSSSAQNLKQKSLSLILNQKKNLSKTLLKTSCLSSQFSHQDIMDNVDIKYCRKIRIYPNYEQLILFGKCLGTSRYIYNKGVEYINNNYKETQDKYNKNSLLGCIYMIKNKQCCKKLETKYFCHKHKDSKLKYNTPTLLSVIRDKVMPNDTDLTDDIKWQSEIPYDTRQLILKSLIGNIKSCLTNLKNGNIDHFDLKFKKKKQPCHVFFINKKAIKSLKIFKTRLKNSKIRVRKKYKNYYNYIPENDCIIKKEYNKYYLLIPKERKTTYKNPEYETISLDPGVRTFQTYYTPNGFCGKIGNNLTNRLYKLFEKTDLFNSLTTKTKNKTKQHVKSRAKSLITKVKNIVNDLHWKTSSFLIKNFQNIIIPKLDVKKLVNKKQRNISKKTSRLMLSLRHCNFIDKLKYKCDEYQRNLIIVDECYTSKTCGRCGYIDHHLGSSKIYKCLRCSLEIDRDYNGARNILLKYLTGLDTTR